MTMLLLMSFILLINAYTVEIGLTHMGYSVVESCLHVETDFNGWTHLDATRCIDESTPPNDVQWCQSQGRPLENTMKNTDTLIMTYKVSESGIYCFTLGSTQDQCDWENGIMYCLCHDCI